MSGGFLVVVRIMSLNLKTHAEFLPHAHDAVYFSQMLHPSQHPMVCSDVDTTECGTGVQEIM